MSLLFLTYVGKQYISIYQSGKIRLDTGDAKVEIAIEKNGKNTSSEVIVKDRGSSGDIHLASKYQG